MTNTGIGQRGPLWPFLPNQGMRTGLEWVLGFTTAALCRSGGLYLTLPFDVADAAEEICLQANTRRGLRALDRYVAARWCSPTD